MTVNVPATVADLEPQGIHKVGCEGFESNKAHIANICKSWCWGHMECEPLPEGNGHYMVCGECMHVFMTADELVNMTNDVASKAHARFMEDDRLGRGKTWVPITDVDLIYFCPVCTHDF